MEEYLTITHLKNSSTMCSTERHLPDGSERGSGLHHRAVRFGKVHLTPLRHLSGNAERRFYRLYEGGRSTDDRSRKGCLCAEKAVPADSEVLRAGVPELQPVPALLRDENIVEPQRLLLKRSKQEAEEVAIRLLKRWGWSRKQLPIPVSCPADSSSVLPLCVRWHSLRPSCSLTEPTSALDPELTGEILESHPASGRGSHDHGDRHS